MSVNSKLTAIADAIRAKTGGTDALTLDGMAEAVAGIQAGGGDDVAAQIVEKTVTEYSSASVKTLGNAAFNGCIRLTSVNLPACTSIGNTSFYDCTSLTSVNLPACTSIGNSAFSKCNSLTSIDLPSCKDASGGYGFSECIRLASVGLPACTSIGNYTFQKCYPLSSINLPVCTSVAANAFHSCYSLMSVVLSAESVCALANKNAFTNCFHILGTVNANYNPEGLKDGYIYVPDALVDSYKAATNWSTYASQIKPLSEYVEVTA